MKVASHRELLHKHDCFILTTSTQLFKLFTKQILCLSAKEYGCILVIGLRPALPFDVYRKIRTAGIPAVISISTSIYNIDLDSVCFIFSTVGDIFPSIKLYLDHHLDPKHFSRFIEFNVNYP
ncbi:hypothetical protein NPIL_409101 [Nephila pilipes]|uniref:Uncharacterized protein n=1 Tax=Nephila pilipes TaxID=299642 RepID=A0A8X6QLK5_NEPPI|nr:hypothetical protein NPIL_409101 [Nephila pilipes]